MPAFEILRTKSPAGLVLVGLALCTMGFSSNAKAQSAWGQINPGTSVQATEKAPLPEEKAFQVDAITTDDGILVRMTPASGYYLYQAKTRFADQSGNVLTGQWPAAEIHNDPHFGPTPIHRSQVEIPLRGQHATTLTVSFQGCQDKGICYPPMQRSVDLSGGGLASSPANLASQPAATPTPPAAAVAEDQAWAATLAGKPWMWTLGAFFLVGLGLSLTPCVLPMVPVVLGIIAPAQAQGRSGANLALLYVLAHAGVLAAAGALGASLGGGAGVVQQMQTPFWLAVGAATFILLGAWQAGWIGRASTGRLTQSLHGLLDKIPQGRTWGAIALGAGSALVLGPCVAPATAGALLYVANEGSVGLGAAALFAMGLGMGAPLMLLAAGGQRLVPTAGAWMENMSKVGAMGLMGVAAILLDRATGQQWQMVWLMAWAIASASLWAKPTVAPQMKTAAATIAVMMLLVSSHLPTSRTQAGGGLQFQTVSASQLREKLAQGQPILLDLSADWCTSCLTMEKTTFADSQVAEAARGMVALRLNLDNIDQDEQGFLKEHGLIGPPAILFFDTAGRELRPARLVGPEEAAPFVERLRSVANRG